MKSILLIGFLLSALIVGYMAGNPQACGAFCGVPIANSISVSEFSKKISTGKAELIDIRTSEEFQAGHLEGATNIDFYQTDKFETYLKSLDKSKTYLIYCRTGNRSSKALELMKQLGFESVSELAGGIASWQSQGKPVVKI